MPRFLLDTDQAQTAADVLRGAPKTYREVGQKVAAGGVEGIPPQAAVHVLSEIAKIEAALLRAGLTLAAEGAILRGRAILLAADDAGTFSLGLLPGSWSWGADAGLGPGGLSAAAHAAGLLGWKGNFRTHTGAGPFGLTTWGEGQAGVDGKFKSDASLGPHGLDAMLDASLFAGVRGKLGMRTQTGPFSSQVDVSGQAGYEAKAKANVKVDGEGVYATGEVGASAGVSAALHSRHGLDRAYVDDRIEVAAGARASASGDFIVRADHIAVKGEAGAFAGLEAKREMELRMGGISNKGGVGVAWGAGAEVSGGQEVSLDKIEFDYKGKIALGPGISYHVGTEIRPREVFSDATNLGEKAGSGARRAVGHAMSLFGR